MNSESSSFSSLPLSLHLHYSKQEITAINQVLWRLGLDDDLNSEDEDEDENLIEVRGKYPNITLVTRLTEVNDLYVLQERDDCLVQSVRTNKYNGLSLDILLDVKT